MKLKLKLKLPRLQGHRGYWKGSAQENTLEAFRQAQQRQLQMIEFDVQLSADNIPVVFHDEDLQRLKNIPDKTSDLTAAQIQLKAQAPTLRDLLGARDIPEYLNLEVKSVPFTNFDLETQIAKELVNSQRLSKIVISSFNPFTLRFFKKHLPQIPRALLLTKEKSKRNYFFLRNEWFQKWCGADLLHLDHEYYSVAEVASFVKKGKVVAVWTVNDKDLAKDYLNAGAISIISDSLVEQDL